MNTPHYLPPDMVPPPPALAPAEDIDVFLVVRTRMQQSEKEMQSIMTEESKEEKGHD